jgi:endogenous inhibitor of DNA gyrase (YacG/DUF329 family)
MKPRIVACPNCGASIPWDPANRFRPFCSERCKMIDLGAWATERYRVPVAEADGADEQGIPENDGEGNAPRLN